MPSVRLCEGDLQIVLSKLNKLDDLVSTNNNKNQQLMDTLQRITVDLELLKTRAAMNVRKHAESGSIVRSQSSQRAMVNKLARLVDNSSTLHDAACATEVAQGVRSLRDSTHWGSIGSSGPPTESESELDIRNMTTVISRRQQRIAKRKPTSPNINESLAKIPRVMVQPAILKKCL